MVGSLVRIDENAQSPTATCESNSSFASLLSSFDPAQLTNLLQRFADQQSGYHATTLQSFPILKPEEQGTIAVPRGQRCALFDGLNDHAVRSRVSSGTMTTLTVLAWVKTSSTGFQCIASEWNDTNQRSWLFVMNGGRAFLYTSPDGLYNANRKEYQTNATYNDGAWHLVAFTWDNGTLKLYVDGAEAAVTKNMDGSGTVLFNTSASFVVGGYLNPSITAPFNGSMRDVRVYNVAKSPSEIAAIYNQHLTPSTIDTTGLLGMWPLQEESGTVAYDVSGNGRHLTLTNITQSTFHATDSGVRHNYNNERGYTQSGNVIIPASLASPSQDAAGNALGNVGPICKPATVEVPCVTGDGSAVYVDCGSALIPATADFTLSFWYYHVTNDTTHRIVLSQTQTGLPAGRFGISANNNAGVLSAGWLTWFVNVPGGAGVNNHVAVNALVAGAWHLVTLARTGNVFSLACTPAGGSPVSNSTTVAVTLYSARNTWLLANASDNLVLNNGRISDLRITTGGVTRYYPLQGGPGTSNTNRDVHWVASDGTGGVVSGAIVNGTVSNIWANRCPYAQDWSINYGGGIAANGAFIPGRIGSNLDAAGNAKTIPAGEQSALALIYPNRWGAPELVNVGITSSTAWGKTTAVQNVSPADTKFRNTTTGRRNLLLSSPAVDPTLTQIVNYVGQP